LSKEITLKNPPILVWNRCAPSFKLNLRTPPPLQNQTWIHLILGFRLVKGRKRGEIEVEGERRGALPFLTLMLVPTPTTTLKLQLQ
jgi:hypothetical protein